MTLMMINKDEKAKRGNRQKERQIREGTTELRPRDIFAFFLCTWFFFYFVPPCWVGMCDVCLRFRARLPDKTFGRLPFLERKREPKVPFADDGCTGKRRGGFEIRNESEAVINYFLLACFFDFF